MLDIQFVGFLAAACTTLSFFPQAIKTIRTKATHGISLSMYIMFTCGVLLWLIYGVFTMDYPIIVANIITLVLAGIILFLKVKHG